MVIIPHAVGALRVRDRPPCGNGCRGADGAAFAPCRATGVIICAPAAGICGSAAAAAVGHARVAQVVVALPGERLAQEIGARGPAAGEDEALAGIAVLGEERGGRGGGAAVGRGFPVTLGAAVGREGGLRDFVVVADRVGGGIKARAECGGDGGDAASFGISVGGRAAVGGLGEGRKGWDVGVEFWGWRVRVGQAGEGGDAGFEAGGRLQGVDDFFPAKGERGGGPLGAFGARETFLGASVDGFAD